MRTSGKGIARTESGSEPGEAYTPFRSKDYLHSAWFASALFSDAHPPAHSTLGTARRSVSFPAFAFTLLHFPCPAHRTPRIQGPPSRADGLRRYALAFVAVCFLPSCLFALRLRKRKPWKLNVNVFKPFGFTDGSRKLCAVRSKPLTASLPAPLCYPARPPPF